MHPKAILKLCSAIALVLVLFFYWVDNYNSLTRLGSNNRQRINNKQSQENLLQTKQTQNRTDLEKEFETRLDNGLLENIGDRAIPHNRLKPSQETQREQDNNINNDNPSILAQ